MSYFYSYAALNDPKPKQRRASLYLSVIGVLLLSSCQSGSGGSATSAINDDNGASKIGSPQQPDPDETLRDPSELMSDQQIRALYSDASCDAISDGPVIDGGTDVIDYRRGLKGRVSIPPEGFRSNLTPWNHLDRYNQPDVTWLNPPIYMSSLNVPTRSFDKGFPTMDGSLIMDLEANPLIEYFRIDLESYLELPNDHSEGLYEVAVLSDDGVRLRVGAASDTLLEYPDKTPTRLICASNRIEMKRGSFVPLKLEYFQGPRYHIALTMLWRPVTPTLEAETECSRSGNDRWFNSNFIPSVPTQNYQDLELRGWKPVPANAFRLPQEETLNPCLSPRVRSVLSGS